MVPVDIRFPDLIDDHISAVEICLQQLKKCDAVIGIFGNRYGSIPPALYRGVYPPRGLEVLKTLDEGMSITDCELRSAIAWKKPLIVFERKLFSESSECAASKEKFNQMKEFVKSAVAGDDVFEYEDGFGRNFANLFRQNVDRFVLEFVPSLDTVECKNVALKSEIFGRKLMLNRAKEIVYAGEMAAVYGKPETGKTLFLRYLYDLEKSRGKRVAWYDCTEDTTVSEILESIRYQLGIKIQPGKDKNALMTSMKSNVVIFIDNAEHLQSLSWIGTLRSDMSIVFAIRRSVIRPEMFAEAVNNWLDLPQLNAIDKQAILNAYLGFSAPADLQSRVHSAVDSRFPRFLKLFALGLKRFLHNVSNFQVPSSFSDLGVFLLERAKLYYGTIIESAVGMLLDGPMQFDDWMQALQFDENGNKVRSLKKFSVCLGF